ncbi:MAG: A24 family peptidase [Nanoarchaeota archaeon]|nr:A24 family peptidase [Nanoarchaeota archaeon]
MVIDILIVLIIILYLIFASISDLKTREVPDYLSYSLIIIVSILKILDSITQKDFTILIYSFLGFIIFYTFSLIMYYSKQWGGGDAKLLMPLGIAFFSYPKTLLNFFTPNLNIPFLLIIIINLLIFGSIYSFIYIFIIIMKNRKKLKNLQINPNKYLLIIPITFVIFSLFATYPLKLLFLTFAFLALIYPYLLSLIKDVERICMIRIIPLSKLTEGDWIPEDIKHRGKLIYNKKSLGVTKTQISLLKKLKFKTVTVKYGIPFIPSFFFSIIFSLTLGNILPF